MKNFVIVCALTIFSVGIKAQTSTDETAIKRILAQQEAEWNKGNIDAFMKAYWKSDSLTFVGSQGPQYGWQKTIDRYKSTYSSREKMGTLKFEILQLNSLGPHHYQMLGKWHLTRTVGDIGGYFTLIFRKFGDGWKIVYDHTS